MKICIFLSIALLEEWGYHTSCTNDVPIHIYTGTILCFMFIAIIICILVVIRRRQTQKVNSFKVVFSLRNKTIYLFFNYFL